MGLACALGVAWILLQTRLEEYDLLQRLPGYREYRRAVPCFPPRLEDWRIKLWQPQSITGCYEPGPDPSCCVFPHCFRQTTSGRLLRLIHLR